MLTKHVTQYLEAYLDNQLPAEERRLVEAHLAVCPTCMSRLQAVRRLADELKPTLLAALGQPTPPLALRQRVRTALSATQGTPRSFWGAPGRVFNAVGTLAVIVLLALGVWTVIQGQLPGTAVLPEISSLRPSSGGDEQPAAKTNTPTLSAHTTPISTLPRSTLGDMMPKLTPAPVTDQNSENGFPLTTPPPVVNEENVDSEPSQNTLIQTDTLKPPSSTIAFSFFNPAPGRQVYEIHLIGADGSNHRRFPLDGVSEPALRSTTGNYQIAYRAYSEPTSPRSLLSSNLDGDKPNRIGGFWEDAQPDWSPKEERVIFASQREVDRRWRLYTAWGDGTAEVNLRREGKSPTFAPDGFRFAFKGCDNTGNRCGLWVGDLKNSEYGAKPFLENPLVQSPDWSPVGEQIAYMANPGDNWDLYVVNSDGSNVRRLTDDPAIDGLPAWSPDGAWLAFLSNRGGNWGIWLLHVASGDMRQIFSFDGGTFTPPNRSPYGQRDWFDEQLSWAK